MPLLGAGAAGYLPSIARVTAENAEANMASRSFPRAPTPDLLVLGVSDTLKRERQTNEPDDPRVWEAMKDRTLFAACQEIETHHLCAGSTRTAECICWHHILTARQGKRLADLAQQVGAELARLEVLLR